MLAIIAYIVNQIAGSVSGILHDHGAKHALWVVLGVKLSYTVEVCSICDCHWFGALHICCIPIMNECDVKGQAATDMGRLTEPS